MIEIREVCFQYVMVKMYVVTVNHLVIMFVLIVLLIVI